jgi:hypothetical protein
MVKRTLLAVMVAALGAAGCGRDDARRAAVVEDSRDAARILQSTPWLDRAPHDERDLIHAWVFPRGEGLYFVGNAYKGSYELFSFFVEDDELRIRFLDDGTTHKLRFQIEKAHDRVFDYKLTLDPTPRGPKVYYGFEQGRALPEAAGALIDRLPARGE